MSLSQFATEPLKVMTTEYRMEDIGQMREEPVVTLFCRDTERARRTVEVEGFHPHFYVKTEAYTENEETLLNDSSIRRIELPESMMTERRESNRAVGTIDEQFQTLDDEPLVRVYTVRPDDTPDLRDWFHDNGYETFEADVFFTDRFCISNDIYTTLEVPAGAERIDVSEIRQHDGDMDVSPRVVTVDIEVLQDGEFPEPTEADKPITSISVHDSYTGEKEAFIRRPNEWDTVPEWEFGAIETNDTVIDLSCPVTVFDDEAEMLGAFNKWVIERDPDIMTGWNSSSNDRGNGFDYPYIINRCRNINEWTIEDVAKDGNTAFVTERGSAVLHGRELVDMMQAYMKTQIHEKRSYALDYISSDELGAGKDDVEDLDEAYKHAPNEFLKYNVRDTMLVVEIERTKNVLDMYDHIRSIVGASYNEIADSNIGLIDILYLRESHKRSIALPTSTRPSVQYYHGAFVAEPVSGLHRNVVYPDLSSLYPNLFRDMNASPETIIGYEDDLQQSEYSKEDCHVVYVDTRSEEIKKDSEPERTPLYVLKPSVKESFIREIIVDLIELKYEYKSDEYDDEAYAAVKRITNSVYGVMGDSASYGVGFRLFDWRIAEAITLAGRDVIKHTADEFQSYVEQEGGYPNAQIIGGDTDSCVCSIPSADGMSESLDIAMDAAEYVDNTYDEFMQERFNISNNNMAVEIESYAERALFMEKKKRYAQRIRWDEGDEVDDIEFKGFELVRSDSAELTAEAQSTVLEQLLTIDNPKTDVSEYLRDVHTKLLKGNVELAKIGKPMSINKSISEYGSENRRPQPHIRGAKWATQNLDGEDHSSGGKPKMFYVDAVRNAHVSETYDAETAEDGDVVDAISVDDTSNIADGIEIDYEKMADKVLRSPIEPIFDVLNWSFNDMISPGSQNSLSAYM